MTKFMATLATVMFALFFTSVIAIAQIAPSSAANLERQRPNILFIFADDMTCQAISAYGDERKLLDTPHMDSIAHDGMIFQRCMVTNSICGPSRATVLTGKYSHLNGFYNNSNCRFDGAQPTYPKQLQAAGYNTAIIGKWHLESDPTGFDYWHILPGQGIYYNPPMIDNGKRVTHDGYVTDIITDLTLNWLENRDTSRPFMLMMQHKAPHREWDPALRHLNWNDDRPFQEPATLLDDLKGRPTAVKDHDMGIATTFTPRDMKLVTPKSLNEEQQALWNAYYEPRNDVYRHSERSPDEEVRWRYQRYMHDYLACVKAVDESVGKVLKYLDYHQLRDNTLVVCTSDQGFFLGEHGWFDKRWIFEESARTPLLVRWPGVVAAGAQCNELVSLIDFAPTFCEATGSDALADAQGESLLPLLRSENPSNWRDSLYYHYYEFPEPHRVRPHYGIITEQFKLVHYYGPDVDEWELLDRQANPTETINYSDDPAYQEIRAKLMKELDEQKKEAKDTAPPPREAYGNAPFALENNP